MPTYIPGISATGTLAPGLTPAAVRAVLELLSSAEIAAAYATTAYVDDEVNANGFSLQAFSSNASNLSTGTVSDARLSSNVPLKNAASNAFTGKIVVPTTAGQTTSIGSTVANGSGVIFQSDRTILCGTNGANLFIAADNRCQVLAGWLQVDSGTIYVGTGDVRIVRNATGPTAETRAAGGLKVANANGSDVAPINCGIVTSKVIGSTTQLVIDPSQYMQWVVGGTNRTTYGYTGVSLFDTATITWSNGSTVGVTTTTLSQASAGVLNLGTTSNNALGSLNLANLTASGTVTVGPTSIGYIDEFTDPLNGSVKALRIGTNTASKRIFIGNPSNASYAVNFSGCATFEGLPNLGNVGTGNLTSNGWIDGKHRPYTFAGLPLASAAQDKTFVCTDSTLAMTSANYGSTPAGGGANRVRLFSNGTAYLLA